MNTSTLIARRDLTALDLIEEAIGLLRTAPSGVIARYFIGTAPFVLSVLYFWSDMSRSAFAQDVAIQSSLLVAGMFIWMKCWQVSFARGLRDVLLERSGSESEASMQIWNLIVNQTVLHVSALIVLPVAAIVILPLMRCVAFYQNVVADRIADAPRLRDVIQRANRYAEYNQRQNLWLILTLWCFGLFVMINLLIALYLAPRLIRQFTGSETLALIDGTIMLNTTFLMVTFGLTYLCVDPIFKAAYTLRCYYAESRTTGDDLRAAFRAVQRRRTAPLASLCLIVIALGLSSPVIAESTIDPAPESTAMEIEAEQLDEAIEQTLSRREYAWRLPREDEAIAGDENFIASFFNRASDAFTDALQSIRDWLDRLFRDQSSRNMPNRGFSETLRVLMLIVLITTAVLIVGGLGWMIWRIVKRYRAANTTISGPVLRTTVPDLTREDVTADELPEDEWYAMSEELLEQGDRRLAMRAMFLGVLARLGRGGLIEIKRFKSNLDYEREMRRRIRENDQLGDDFSQHRQTYERVWYGQHPVTEQIIAEFRESEARLRVDAEI